jgi:hypothetical protein
VEADAREHRLAALGRRVLGIIVRECDFERCRFYDD